MFDPLNASWSEATSHYSDGIMSIRLPGDGGKDDHSAVIDKKGAVAFSKDKGYLSQPIDGVIVRSGRSIPNDNILQSSKVVTVADGSDDVPLEYYDAKGNKLFDRLNVDKMRNLPLA